DQRRQGARSRTDKTIPSGRRLSDQCGLIGSVEFIGADGIRQRQARAFVLSEIDPNLAVAISPQLNEWRTLAGHQRHSKFHRPGRVSARTMTQRGSPRGRKSRITDTLSTFTVSSVLMGVIPSMLADAPNAIDF